MDKILNISFEDLLKQFKKNLIPLVILTIILILINSYFLLNQKNTNYKAGIDFYPLQEFAYSDLWLLQQEFLLANKGLVTFTKGVGPLDSPSIRYLPKFMHLNELTLFKFFKDFILSNKRSLVTQVSKNLNIEGGFSVTFNDMSNHEFQYLANNYVSLTFYNPTLLPEEYPQIMKEFIQLTRLRLNKILNEQARKNINFIDDYIKNQEDKLLVYVNEIVDIFKNKIETFEEAAMQAKKLNISTSLLSNSNYNVVNGTDNLDSSSPSTTIYLQTYNVDILPTVSSGFEALEAHANFYKTELSAVLKSLTESKYHDIFTLHAQYAGSLNYAKSSDVSRETSQRKIESKKIATRLTKSKIANGNSPLIDINYNNIYYYDAKNKLLIPILSIMLLILFVIFSLFANVLKFEK